MNLRPAIALIVLSFLCGVLLAAETETVFSSQRVLADDGSIAQQIYENTATLRSLDERITMLENSRNVLSGIDSSNGERIASLIAKVDFLDRMIWWELVGLGSPLFLLFIEASLRVTKRSDTFTRT